MRIGVVAHVKHAICEPFAGGLEMHTDLLTRLLRQRGHEVTVFASTRSQPQLGLEAICDETEFAHLGVAEATDVPFFKEHHAYLSLMTRLRTRDLDLIHNNSLHYLPVAMAGTLPMPMVTTLHTPPFGWLESGIRTSKESPSTFVAISGSIRRSWGAITPIDRVVMNGVDLDRFRYRAKPDDPSYLVWYGRIVPEKGLHLAIEAAHLAGEEIRFAGPIMDRDYFDAEIAPRLDERTRYLGHLTHEKLADVIAGSTAFVCSPCWEEPYGLVVAEALACGVPVAAFARGAIPEIVDPTCGVLATPGDPRSLADAVAAAKALRRSDCRCRAETFCSAGTMIDGYEELYGELVDRRRLDRDTSRRERSRAGPSTPASARIRVPVDLPPTIRAPVSLSPADQPQVAEPPSHAPRAAHDVG